MDIREINRETIASFRAHQGGGPFAGETFQGVAVDVAGAGRDELFARIAGRHPFFHDYQARDGRVIPVVELTRA